MARFNVSLGYSLLTETARGGIAPAPLQLKMMEEQQAEKLFIDKASGKNTDRAAFKEMMGFVRAGDIVVVESISRIARNTRDLLSIVSDLTARQVEFVSLKENIDTTTPQGFMGL